MGYIRDESTGKFVWVDGDLDDARSPAPGAEAGSANDAGGAAAAPRPWLLWMVILAVVLVLAIWSMLVMRQASESIANIRTRPASYDGRSVVLKGRVGEVFGIGGSWAYYLHQDRDTIVVFTRGPRPLEHQAVTVRGSISMGYMDGVARPALFESEAKQ